MTAQRYAVEPVPEHRGECAGEGPADRSRGRRLRPRPIGVVGLSVVLAVLLAGHLGACGDDPFVGTWGADGPAPGVDRLEMTIEQEGDVYSVTPTEGIEDGQPVAATCDGDELTGTVTIEELTIELRFVPGEQPDTLDLQMTARQEDGRAERLDVVLDRTGR